jgi:hypothetical protein
MSSTQVLALALAVGESFCIEMQMEPLTIEIKQRYVGGFELS